MKKLLQFLDENVLSMCVSALLVFTVLYPKLPSIKIPHTWVYIRLEDFAIALTVGLWAIQTMRRKVKWAWPISLPIFLYWVAGSLSLIYSLIFLAPHLANFFPSVAIFSFLRRIEYMVLFFVSLSTIKSPKDITRYIFFITLAVAGACVYGFGQRYYINLWAAFPDFFRHYQFCFPSFQTGNEEFAKGIPLCLPADARITSTFGGHYDLAAYMVVVLPILTTLLASARKWKSRIMLGILSISGLSLLILTASRVSYIAYLVGAVCALIFFKKKWFIIPVIFISIVLLFTFSQSTAKRFMQTFSLTSVVTNNQGQIIGQAESNLPADLKNKISKNPIEIGNVVTQNLPAGSAFLSLGGSGSTNSAYVSTSLNNARARQLNLDNGGIEISTISGNFLVHKALVYDISFTTRLQGEWPNAVNAFLRNPLLGSGFSTITLATDNDFLRSLGETGLLGFITFGLIFMMMGIALREIGPHVTESRSRGYVYGLAGGVIGLFFNAALIDVFESSKVAENLWMLLGIGVGILLLFAKNRKIAYITNLKQIFTSNLLNGIYLLVGLLVVFSKSIGNYLVADDFTWMHWASSSTIFDLKNNFVNASGFFYRPLDKLVVFFLNTIFALQPGGYHLFSMCIHYILVVGVYLFTLRLTEKKSIAITAAVLFLLLPVHGENLFWFATISTNLSTLCMFFALFCFYKLRKTGSIFLYIVSIFLFIAALFSYEMSVIFPLILLSLDLIVIHVKWSTKTLVTYIPYVLLVPIYLLIRNHAHAVAGGGDYSYSLSHLVPNLVGNTFGYLSLLLFGGRALPVYTYLRDGTRVHAVLFGIIAALIIVIFGILLYTYRKAVRHYASHQEGRVVLFGLVMAFVSLLPFIDLGNISERYAYLGSIGFCIAVAVLLQKLFVILFAKQKKYVSGALAVCVVLISILFYFQVRSENADWARAGIITHRTLSTFRVDYELMPHGSTLYFVNVPVKKGLAWVFPYTSLSDGLWFVYRDDSQRIYQVASMDQAIQMRDDAAAAIPSLQRSKLQTFYIFQFDQNGSLHEVKDGEK